MTQNKIVTAIKGHVIIDSEFKEKSCHNAIEVSYASANI